MSPKEEQFSISLVVCTRNRAVQLPRCMQSISRLSFDGVWEVVVVDNGSTDDTARVIDRYRQKDKVPLVVVREERPGLARARNTGLLAARGRIVAFTDDDCYPAPDYLQVLCECFADSDIKFLGGRVLLFDKNDAPISIQEKADREEIAPRSFIRPGFIHGANIAFDRDALLSVGGFDERLGAGTKFFSGEDVEILARMSWAGMRGAYDPRPVVQHHHGRRQRSDIERLFRGYDIGRGAYFAKFLANKESRLTYMKNWYWSIRLRNLARLGREIAGAARFARIGLGRAGGIWGTAAVQSREQS